MEMIRVYLEVGKKRTFAAALDWPGWCRIGRDETEALQTLLDYGPRYELVVRSTGLDFNVPQNTTVFDVTERLTGNATTDFGAPGMVPESDFQPVDETELRRLQTLLGAIWQAFDAAVENASEKTLRIGPRGGGRSVEKIVEHTHEAEKSYLSKLGGKASQSAPSQSEIREVILETLEASARGEIDETGPRGGKRWPPRYFVRRAAWHVLDHLWEIEDRLP